jgi:hypothetical protein
MRVKRISKIKPTIFDDEKLIIINMFADTKDMLEKSMNSSILENTILYKYFNSFKDYFDKGYKFEIYDITEGNNLNKTTRPIENGIAKYSYSLYDILEKFGDSIKIVSNNLKEDKFVKSVLFFMSQHWLDHHEYKLVDYPILKHFIYLNRVPKIERVLLMEKMMNNDLLKNCFYSFNPNGDIDYKGYNPKLKPKSIEGGEVIAHHIENFKGASSNYDVMKTYEDSAFISIITESEYGSDTIFFSEKTTKYLTLGKPFILYSSPHSIKKLHELGFKTFDKWWDESYDEEKDINKRTDKIINIVKEISAYSLDKLISIRKDMQEILKHNHQTIKKLEQTHSQYFDYKLI